MVLLLHYKPGCSWSWKQGPDPAVATSVTFEIFVNPLRKF